VAEALDIEALYERYGPMVLRRCRGLLRDEEKAVEAMQDVFVQVLRRQSTLRAEHPSSLLYQIATNVSLNLLRSRSRRPEDAVDDELLTRIATAPETDGRSIAKLTLDKLFGNEPASSRTMAVLHLLDGHTLEEVATMTGMSVSGVRKRLRGLQAHVNELEGIQEGVQ
jgi:RNA polymerase sigma factor (sigma-70 family)